jgi:hypothetical protein
MKIQNAEAKSRRARRQNDGGRTREQRFERMPGGHDGPSPQVETRT